ECDGIPAMGSSEAEPATILGAAGQGPANKRSYGRRGSSRQPSMVSQINSIVYQCFRRQSWIKLRAATAVAV
ncbi:hypothetical protein ACWEO2_36350, partial [Nocardia sp. NPDC004278]